MRNERIIWKIQSGAMVRFSGASKAVVAVLIEAACEQIQSCLLREHNIAPIIVFTLIIVVMVLPDLEAPLPFVAASEIIGEVIVHESIFSSIVHVCGGARKLSGAKVRTWNVQLAQSNARLLDWTRLPRRAAAVHHASNRLLFLETPFGSPNHFGRFNFQAVGLKPL
jgi:hypothetical protein